MHIHAKTPREYVDNVYSNRYTFDVACRYNNYSSTPHGEITIGNNQNTMIVVCGTPLQHLHNIVLSRFHSSVTHYAIIIVAYVGAPLQLDACMGTENLAIATFHISYSNAPTYFMLQLQ
jgi:hypothetical protein